MVFEYNYRFSVAEDMLSRYNAKFKAKYIFEITTHFTVKQKYDLDEDDDDDGDEIIIIDSERYAMISTFANFDYMLSTIGMRLHDYNMPNFEIEIFLLELQIYTLSLPSSRRGKIPVAVDIEVCAVQQEGEAIEAAVERAVRTEYLPPLHLFPVSFDLLSPRYCSLLILLRYSVEAEVVSVDDVEVALRFMRKCGICRWEPVAGIPITRLGCGHAFHYCCIVRWLGALDECPKCTLPQFFDHGSDSNSDSISDSDDYDSSTTTNSDDSGCDFKD